MPFIDRDETEKIKGVYACQQHKGQEWIIEDAKELLEFYSPIPTEEQLYEAAIKAKEAEILRRQAIAELEAEKIAAEK